MDSMGSNTQLVITRERTTVYEAMLKKGLGLFLSRVGFSEINIYLLILSLLWNDSKLQKVVIEPNSLRKYLSDSAVQNRALKEIYDILKNDIDDLEDSILVDLVTFLSDEKLMSLNDFGKNRLIASFLDHLIDRDAKTFSSALMPREVIEFIAKQLPDEGILKIYNPFCGTASLLEHLDYLFRKKELGKRKSQYYGVDSNKYVISLAQLRSYWLNRLPRQNLKTEFSRDNVDSHGTYFKNKANVIFSSPPTNVFGQSGDENIYYNLIETWLEDFPANCSLILFLPTRVLESSQYSEERDMLIQSGRLKSIILLPHGLLKLSSISFSLITCGSLGASRNKEIEMIDGSTFFELKGSKKVLSTQLLQHAVKSTNSSFKRTVDIETIKEKRSILTPKRYFVASSPKGIELSYFLNEAEPTSGSTRPILTRLINSKLPILRTNDLINLETYINLDKIALQTIRRTQIHRYKKIDFSCLIVSRRLHKIGGVDLIAASVFEFKGKPLFIDRESYLVLGLKFPISDSSQFILYLKSLSIAEQFKSLASTSLIPSINVQDFLLIKMPAGLIDDLRYSSDGFMLTNRSREQKRGGTEPFNSGNIREKQLSIEVQELRSKLQSESLKVERSDAMLKELKDYNKENERLYNSRLEKIKSEYKKSKIDLEHTIGTSLKEIKENTAAVNEILVNPEFEKQVYPLNEIFKNVWGGLAASDLIEEISRHVELIQKKLSGTIDKNYEKFQLNKISILEFFDWLEKKAVRRTKFDVKIINGIRWEIADDDLQDVYLKTNLSLVLELLAHIFDNAGKHAFQNDNPSNLIEIEIKAGDDNFFYLYIRDNGCGFGEMTKDMFVQQYKTTKPEDGEGMGGCAINEIAAYLNLDWELYLNETLPFPVEFMFKINLL